MAPFAPLSSLLVLTLLAVSVVALESRNHPSGTPSCYTCPSKDELNFALGDHSAPGNTLLCYYPLADHPHEHDFSCTYSSITGNIKDDNDDGYCPPSATTKSSCSSKRDDNFKAMKRRHDARDAKRRAAGRGMAKKRHI